MKESLNSYLIQNPTSSLDVYRDLYIAQLERNVDLELQKFSLDFNSLPPQQKEFLLSELDKAVTNINLMRGVISDINKQVEAEQARNAYFEAVDVEKLKKEQDELQERKMLASLEAAVEIAALKTSASMSAEPPPSLAAIAATQELDKNFVQNIKLIDEQLIKATELLLSKVKIVADADIDPNLAESGSMDENDNLSRSSTLFNVIFWPENAIFIAGELGINVRDVNMMNLKVIGDEVVFQGSSEKRMNFSLIEELFRSSDRNHATEMRPFLLGDVERIRDFKERGEVKRIYLAEKQQEAVTSSTQSFEWRTAILAERGITVDINSIDEQMATLKASSPQSFVELILREEAAQAILVRYDQEFETNRSIIEKSPEVQRINLFEELLQSRNLKRTETVDRSAPNIKLYTNEKEERSKGKFTKIAEESKGKPIKFSELVENSKDAPTSLPLPPLPRGK